MTDDAVFADYAVNGGNGGDKDALVEMWQEADAMLRRLESDLPEGARVQKPILDDIVDRLGSSLRPVWGVDKLIETPSLVEMFSPSGVGKSFVALDLALAAATGGEWAGRSVTATGPVVYLNGEGARGLDRRVCAWQIHHKKEIPRGRFFVSSRTVEFDEKGAKIVEGEIDVVVNQAGQPPSFIFVDTLARHLVGNENAPDDMGTFIGHMTRLKEHYNAVVFILHHTGQKETERARAHSSFKAALDTEFRLARRGTTRIMEISKCRDLPDDPKPLEFILRPVIIETTLDGEIITSVVVGWQEPGTRGVQAKCTRVEALAIDTLQESIARNGGLHATVDDWRPLFYGKHWGDTDNAKKAAFRRVRQSLDEKKMVGIEGGRYFIPGAMTSDRVQGT